MSFYFETDYPDSIEVINALEKAIENSLKTNKYKIAAIGIDVYIDKEEPLQKISAIEIRTYTLSAIEINYFQYQKKEYKYSFEKN